jgi:hypothetical protein
MKTTAIGSAAAMAVAVLLAACSGGSGGGGGGGSSASSVTGTYATQEASSDGNTYSRAMSLTQDGDHVTGQYQPTHDAAGTLDGTLDGRVLTGTWTQGGASGPIAFTFADDDSSFTGTWDYAGGPGTYEWDGTRTGTAPTTIGGASSSGSTCGASGTSCSSSTDCCSVCNMDPSSSFYLECE